MFLRPGKGKITVNGRTFEHYFPSETCARDRAAAAAGDRDGGQVRHSDHSPPAAASTGRPARRKLGIARALVEFNSELRGKLKELGLLTRDAREHERKKYGQKGARKRFQFSQALVDCRCRCARDRGYVLVRGVSPVAVLHQLSPGRKFRFGPWHAGSTQ